MLPVAISRVPQLHLSGEFLPLLTRPRFRRLGVKMEALERRLFRSAGAADASFGGNGLIIHDLFGGTNGIGAIVEDAQGRIYAAVHAPISQEAANTDSSADPAGRRRIRWRRRGRRR